MLKNLIEIFMLVVPIEEKIERVFTECCQLKAAYKKDKEKCEKGVILLQYCARYANIKN